MLRRASVALTSVAVGITALAWLQAPAPLSADEAIDTVERALAEAEVTGSVDAPPDRGTYRAGAGDGIGVWMVEVALDRGPAQIWLARADGEPVYLDDRTPDGAGLLTDPQVEALDRFDDNPAAARQLRRNVVASVAAVAIALMAMRLALHARRVSPRPTPLQELP